MVAWGCKVFWLWCIGNVQNFVISDLLDLFFKQNKSRKVRDQEMDKYPCQVV